MSRSAPIFPMMVWKSLVSEDGKSLVSLSEIMSGTIRKDGDDRNGRHFYMWLVGMASDVNSYSSPKI